MIGDRDLNFQNISDWDSKRRNPDCTCDKCSLVTKSLTRDEERQYCQRLVNEVLKDFPELSSENIVRKLDQMFRKPLNNCARNETTNRRVADRSRDRNVYISKLCEQVMKENPHFSPRAVENAVRDLLETVPQNSESQASIAEGSMSCEMDKSALSGSDQSDCETFNSDFNLIIKEALGSDEGENVDEFNAVLRNEVATSANVRHQHQNITRPRQRNTPQTPANSRYLRSTRNGNSLLLTDKDVQITNDLRNFENEFTSPQRPRRYLPASLNRPPCGTGPNQYSRFSGNTSVGRRKEGQGYELDPFYLQFKLPGQTGAQQTNFNSGFGDLDRSRENETDFCGNTESRQNCDFPAFAEQNPCGPWEPCPGLSVDEGLSLASGLVVFASVVSDVALERPKRSNSPGFQYRYGWSFFSAGAAFVLSEVAAVLCITAYLRRFPTAEDMVRAVVPGAERKLLASRHSDYGVRTPSEHNKELLVPAFEENLEGPLLTKPPDLCSTANETQCQSCKKEQEKILAGAAANSTTVPITLGTLTLRPQRSTPAYEYNRRYATLGHTGVLHAGVLGVHEGSGNWSSGSSPSSGSSCPRPPRKHHKTPSVPPPAVI